MSTPKLLTETDAKMIQELNTLDYSGILKNGVNVVPLKESWADWRSDYSRTIVMIYNDIPSFDDLMQFAAHLEKEFNDWVSNK